MAPDERHNAAAAIGSRSVPVLTMGLPVHNGEAFLEEAIGAAIAQTHEDFLLIISDNASTDATEEICLSYAARDDRIIYVRNRTNIGAAPNFNRVFELAPASPYFKWCAADDFFSPSYAESCIAALEEDPLAALAFGAIAHTDASGSVEEAQHAFDLSIRGSTPAERARSMLRSTKEGFDIYWALYGVIRRSAILSTRLHGSYIASDQVLVLELALAGRLAQVPDAVFFHRRHDGSFAHVAPGAAERAVWFDSRSKPRAVFPHWKLFAEHIRAVERTPVSRLERCRGHAAISRRVAREWRNLAGDVKAVGLDVVRRRIDGRLSRTA